MKPFFICLITLAIVSCSLDEDSRNTNSYLDFLPIETVSMPEVFELGESYQIDLTYLKPTTCYTYNDIFYDVEGNTITIAVINSFYDNGNCQPVNLQIEKSFNFNANNTGVYIFKFWLGDSNVNTISDDNYLTYEIEIVE